jgi:hypothetical protein
VKPSAFELFCMYYLGLTPEFQARFYNLNAVARHYGVSPREVEGWLLDFHISASYFPRIEFNLAEAHGKAQEVALFSSRDDARAFARKTFQEVLTALDTYSDNAYFEDVDYNDIWGDSK